MRIDRTIIRDALAVLGVIYVAIVIAIAGGS